jgi:hypothetical protein
MSPCPTFKGTHGQAFAVCTRTLTGRIGPNNLIHPSKVQRQQLQPYSPYCDVHSMCATCQPGKWRWENNTHSQSAASMHHPITSPLHMHMLLYSCMAGRGVRATPHPKAPGGGVTPKIAETLPPRRFRLLGPEHPPPLANLGSL